MCSQQSCVCEVSNFFLQNNNNKKTNTFFKNVWLVKSATGNTNEFLSHNYLSRVTLYDKKLLLSTISNNPTTMENIYSFSPWKNKCDIFQLMCKKKKRITTKKHYCLISLHHIKSNGTHVCTSPEFTACSTKQKEL